MRDVIELLKDKYELNIAFDHQAVKDIFIDKDIRNLEISQALKVLFSDTDLTFQIIAPRQVLLRKTSPSDQENTEGEIFTFNGKVIDGLNGQPLAFASVFSTPHKGTTSDEDGKFSFELYPSDPAEKITFQYLGYTTKTFKLTEIHAQDNLVVRLMPEIKTIEHITVEEKVPFFSQKEETNEATILNIPKLYTLPSFVGGKDIFRSLQLLPGISASNDLSAELKVRGSASDENMVVLDGITLYNIGHYFGIFSIINPNVVEEVKLYKNAFPVEYGGRTASVLDISTHPVSKLKAEGSAEFNLLTSNAMIQVPVLPNLGFMLGGRITNGNVADAGLFDLLNTSTRTTVIQNQTDQNGRKRDLVTLAPDFRFSDLNVKGIWQLQPSTSLSASYFRGFDKFNYSFSESFEQEFQNKRPRSTTAFTESAQWQNSGLSFRLFHQWNEKLYSKLTFSKSSYQSENTVTSDFQRIENMKKDTVNRSFHSDNFNKIEGFEINAKNTWSLSDRQEFTFGYHLTKNRVDFKVRVDNERVSDDNPEAQQHSLYFQSRTALYDNLQLSIGLRSTYYNQTQKVYLSPRLFLSYKLNDQWRLKASWSRYHQFLRQSFHENPLGRTYDFWILADDEKFPLLTSRHLMAGFKFKNELFSLDVELYQKNTNGVLEQAPLLNGFDSEQRGPSKNPEYKIFKGTGLSQGVDVMLSKSYGKYTGWVAYTLSKTTNSFPDIKQGETFPSQDDSRHQFKWINQYRLKNWNFSMTYLFSSGRPYTDLSALLDKSTDRRELSSADRISYLDDYHRVDIGVNRNFSLFGKKGEFGFSVFNLFNRSNVKYRQYIWSIGEHNNQSPKEVIGTELKMLGITPNLSFKLNF
ncbi:MAG: TonB-dependent receptor [Bacteroidetes bacterium]|nr:TonB-dependent receptor [Bacteroidota bacterium]